MYSTVLLDRQRRARRTSVSHLNRPSIPRRAGLIGKARADGHSLSFMSSSPHQLAQLEAHVR